MHSIHALCSLGALLGSLCFANLLSAAIQSHPAMRPLPTISTRSLTSGPLKFVDARGGNDDNDGTQDRPWKTLHHAVKNLSPGETLYLRSGVYFENVSANLSGAQDQPITLCSYPGELAIIDGGLREFIETPSTAWELVPNGAVGEYRSTKTYPDLPAIPNRTNLLGNFANSMVPLHGYRFLTDLRSNNHLFRNLGGSKTDAGTGLYCGPGVYLDSETHRIHIRLEHTDQPSIGEANNYRGETDPRKLPLVIAAAGQSAFELNESNHVILRDLVFRGSRDATLNLIHCSNITLDGVTSYGGSAAMKVKGTHGFTCLDSAFRGIAAPWLWRWSLKYRSIEARIVSASHWNPPARGNKDFRFSRCEFTDCVDGVFLGNVEGCLVEHSFLDNVSDDGFFLTSRTAYDGTTPSKNIVLRNNRISRVLTAFAFGVGHGRQRTLDSKGNKQLGQSVQIDQNVIDLRDPVQYQQPESGPIVTYGRVAGDHGSPIWEPMEFVRNTIYMNSSPWRNYYGAGLGKAMRGGTQRSILHNWFIHETGMPGEVLPGKEVDLTIKGNGHWSEEFGKEGKETFLKRFHGTEMYRKTGWTNEDKYISPREDIQGVGVSEKFSIGVHGRLTQDGKSSSAAKPPIALKKHRHPPYQPKGSVALVLGYPAFDAPILQFAMEKQNWNVKRYERTWLPVDQFYKYDYVAFLGSTVRARMEPSGFQKADHAELLKYMKDGGVVIIGRELMRQLFPDQEGRRFVETITGTAPQRAKSNIQVLDAHAWTASLQHANWTPPKGLSAIPLSKGHNLIGDRKTKRSILADISVGKGRLIYIGWDIARYLPSGRKPSSVQQEETYLQQYKVYENLIRSLTDKE